MLTPVSLALIAVASATFQVELQADIVQRRDVVDPGHQVVELVRILPPTVEPWTMTVHVPDSWVDRPRSAHSPAELVTAARSQVHDLRGAVKADIPWSPGLDPLDAAGLWAGLLRNSAHANPHPISHYDGVLEPWELLYDAQAGDTMSAAIVALIALDGQGTEASLCRYPTPSTSTGVAFGLIVEGVAPAGADWAWAVGGVTPAWALLPMHLKAKPSGALQASDLEVWTLAQVRAEGWDPGATAQDALSDGDDEPTPAPAPTPDGADEPEPPAPAPPPAPPPERTPRPDVCAQAEAMGLECRPVDHSNDGLWLLLAGLALAGITAAGVTALVTRSRRQAAARARKQRRKAEDF
jgi:hypothetical protein